MGVLQQRRHAGHEAHGDGPDHERTRLSRPEEEDRDAQRRGHRDVPRRQGVLRIGEVGEIGAVERAVAEPPGQQDADPDDGDRTGDRPSPADLDRLHPEDAADHAQRDRQGGPEHPGE
ncbi:hypothetical protein NKG05_19875 [Oerskovia sp. M15]